MKQSKLEAWFILLIEGAGLPKPVAEYRFCQRRWRFDYAYPKKKIGIELDGGIWLPRGGRHNRGKGYIADTAKLNQAVLDGWRVLRYTRETIHNAVEDLQELL